MDTAALREREEDMARARAGWPEGPWTKEPDRVEWTTRVGLPGLIVRTPMGALCGYAAVSPGHPAHGRSCGDVDVSVHGGLTYADACAGAICHAPAPGESDDVWWFGFDCAHAQDLAPGLLRARETVRGLVGEESAPWDVYRDIAYVTDEVENLAEQLVAIGRTS